MLLFIPIFVVFFIIYRQVHLKNLFIYLSFKHGAKLNIFSLSILQSFQLQKKKSKSLVCLILTHKKLAL